MARDMYGSMAGPSAWMMTSVWDGRHLLLLWTMWAVMMAAMMLPSAWPMLAMYGTFSERQQPGLRHSSHLYLFAGGYVVVWALYSVAATILQRALAGLLLLSPMMELASPTRKRGVSDPRRRLSDDAAQTGVPSAVPIADLVSVRALASGLARGASHGPGARRSTAWAAAGR